MTVCERCGKVLQLGEYPFCGGRNQHGFPMAGLKQIGDEIDEWNENVGHEPVHFTSRQERKRYLKEHGLQEFVRHVGEQGSDKSKHTTRWV
jgi:hypothetical protein